MTVLICLLLAACGAPILGSGNGTPSPTTTATPSTEHCPVQQPPSGVTPADIVVNGGGQNATPVAMRVGQTLDIHTPAAYLWTQSIDGPATVLRPRQDNGWYDATSGTCVWRFTALTAGQVTISFTGRPYCPPGQVCPAFVFLLQFPVHVSA
jgi:hypothetical protein